MPFQFMCPQGHLLEGSESQMGQQSQCPLCGTAFIVPFVQPPPGQPAGPQGLPPQPGGGQPAWPQGGYAATSYGGAATGYPQYQQTPAPEQPYAPPGSPPTFPQPEMAGATTEVAMPAVGETAAIDTGVAEPPQVAEQPAEPKEDPNRVVRILCPNGHELHTPMDMLGMDALCPECNAQFRLRYEDSLEYAEELRAAKAKRDEAFNKAALKWSIAAAVVVLLALVVMIVLSQI